MKHSASCISKWYPSNTRSSCVSYTIINNCILHKWELEMALLDPVAVICSKSRNALVSNHEESLTKSASFVPALDRKFACAVVSPLYSWTQTHAVWTYDMNFTELQILGYVIKKQRLWKAKEQALISEYKCLHLLVKIWTQQTIALRRQTLQKQALTDWFYWMPGKQQHNFKDVDACNKVK